jgi:hypothetical protein
MGFKRIGKYNYNVKYNEAYGTEVELKNFQLAG